MLSLISRELWLVCILEGTRRLVRQGDPLPALVRAELLGVPVDEQVEHPDVHQVWSRSPHLVRWNDQWRLDLQHLGTELWSGKFCQLFRWFGVIFPTDEQIYLVHLHVKGNSICCYNLMSLLIHFGLNTTPPGIIFI